MPSSELIPVSPLCPVFIKYDFNYSKCEGIRSYNPLPVISNDAIDDASKLINSAKKPLIVWGQGVILGNAEKEFKDFVEKSGIPAAWTILGLSALPTSHNLNVGMVGMHGNYGPNILTNKCDLLIAIGMRFDDRVTGDPKTYASQAKIIHLDIDPAEINKNIIMLSRMPSSHLNCYILNFKTSHLLSYTGHTALL